MPEAPRRAVVLTAEIQADSRRELSRALFDIATQLHCGEINGPVVISGGYSSGYILHLEEGEHPTHDEWAEQIKAYLAAKRGEAG